MANKFTILISRLLLIVCFLFTGYQGFAQYTVTTLSTGGSYTAMAKDQNDNIYVVRYNGTNYEVAKYASGNPASTTVIYTGLSSGGGSDIYSWGLTVNSLGDVFVTNAYQPSGWQIIKLTAPFYSASVIHSGNYYSALGIDAANNLLSMEYNAAGSGNGTYRLVRYPAGSENAAGTTLYDGFTYNNGSLSYPWGIVTDAQSNIYLLDFLENSGGRLVKLVYPGYAPTVLSTSKSFTSLAIDAGDNIYTCERINASTAKVVKYTDPAAAGTTLYSGLTNGSLFYPWGLAVNSSGQIYVNDGAASGNGRVLRLDPPASLVSSVVRAASSPTNATSATFTVTFNRAITGISTASFSLTTTGISGASIASVSGSGATYTVVVNTGAGTGTIRLNVTGTGVTPATTNVPYTTGEVYAIDKTSPAGSLSINSGATVTNNTTVTLTTSATDGNSIQMRFSNNGTSWSAYEALGASKSWSLSTGEGLKTVYVQYLDAAGNTVSYSESITLDQTAPETTITGGPANPTNSQLAAFSFSSNEAGSSFQYSYDGSGFITIPGVSPYSFSGIPEGTHTMKMRAIDPAGNVDGTPDAYTWTVDLTSPAISSVLVPADGYYKAGDALTFTVNYAENVVAVGTPYLDVILNSGTVKANYLSGSGTGALTFRYIVVDGDMDLNGIALGTNVQLNGGTINDPAGNSSLTALQNTGSTSGVLVNATKPTVTLTSTQTAVLNQPITFKATFSEAVTGFSSADVHVTNGTVAALSTSDNITYNITVMPIAAGAVTIDVPAAAAINIAGNSNQASNTLSFTFDNIQPTVTSVAVPANGYYKAGDQLNFITTFSEAVVLDTISSKPFIGVTIGSATVNAVLSSATATTLTFTYTVVAGDKDLDGITVGNLSLNGSTIKDIAGNNATLTLNSVGSTANVMVNTDRPSVTLSAPATANGPYTATITFSEAVTGFAAGDVTVGNGVASNLVTSNNIVFTVTITPSAGGTVTLNVGANVATNIGGNGNTAATQVSTANDITMPVVTSVSVPANGYYKAGDKLNFTVKFSEPVLATGTPYLTVTIGSSVVNASLLSSTDSSLTFSYTVADGDQDMDGITPGTLNGTIKDAVGNNATLTLHNVGATTGVFVNTTHATAIVSATAAAIINAPYTARITFSEAVTGFVQGDITVTNATLSNLLTSDNITYTVLVTPLANGNVTLSVPANAAVNIGNNGNAISNTLINTYDATAPTVTSVAVPADGYYKAGDLLNFTATCSETVVLDTTSSKPFISVTIGTTTVNAVLSSATATTLTFTYTVVAGDKDLNGITVGNLSLNGSTIKDIAGNNATLTLNSIGSTANVKVNTDRPSVILTAPAIANGPYTATITFNEAVTGFTAGDITVGNGVASNLVTTNNTIFTATITPSAEGVVILNIGANVATNIGGNGNSAATQVSTLYDITLPVVTSVSVPPNAYYKAGDKLNFTVKFSEPVLATGTPYLTVTIGSSVVNAGLLSSADSSLTFSYTVADGDQDMDGVTPGTLNGTIKDAVGNNATLTLHNVGATTGVFVNTTHATAIVSTTAAAIINAPYTAKITFSEAVTGFVQGDITVTNATLSNLLTSDNITYTVLVTPLADGNVTLTVPANAAVNIGNNGNHISNTLTNTYDAAVPIVTSVNIPANGYYRDGNTLNFTVHFSETVLIDSSIAKPYINIVIGSTTVRAPYRNMPSTDAVNFSYTVLPGQTDLDGIAVGTLSGSIADPAGNAAVLTLNNVSSTANVFVKTSTPSVVLSTTAATRVNAMFTVKAVFSEAVTGLIAGDFTVANGSAANLQTTDNITYTIDITPVTDGEVSIYLPAGMAVNVVSNSNTASDIVKRVYDITAPLITAGQAFSTSERSPVGTLVGNVAAVETAGILQNWTITNDGSGGAFSIDNTGAIYVKNTVLLASNANSTVNVTITVSDGLNTSIAQAVAITIRFVNRAPVLDPIKDIVLCMDTEMHTVQLTGASAVETGQTYSFSVSADKPGFDVLSVNAAGILTYELKANTSGIIKVTVTIKDDGGTADGGVDASLHTFTITVNSLPVTSISSDKGTTISKGDVVQLTATGGNTYIWDSGETTGVVAVRPMNNTTYKVTATNAEGCKNTAEITIKVLEDFKVDAVNLLTPNGDGKNDRWVIRNLDSYPNNEVKIYDRAGRIVYTRRNYSNDWDGTMNGSPLAEGTYYYILTIDGGKTAKGFITIIRGRN